MRAFAYDIATRAGGRLRPLRNLAFRTRLRHDPAAPAVLLSPHVDDAVLDCWSLLTDPAPLRVVNVFAGVPARGTLTYFDRLAGACDSAAHMRRRLAEDEAALTLAGRSAINLGFLALPYRRARPEPAFAALDAALAAEVGAAAMVYAPAALANPHPDHALVRDYALALARQGVPARLYADLPYCAVYGWPAWVTGGRWQSNLNVEAYWDGPAGPSLRGRAHVVRLDRATAAAKLAAMRTYEAEFAVLDHGVIGQLSNPAVHGFEVFWALGGA